MFGYLLLGFIILTISISAYAQLIKEKKIDVILLIDTSASMEENDPNQYRLEAAKLFVSLANSGDRIGIVTFGDEGKRFSNLVKLPTEKSKRIMQGEIDKIKTESIYTNITHGLRVAYGMLEDRIDKTSDGVLIMLTDGQLEIPGDKEREFGSKALDGEIEKFEEREWPIYTVGFGQADKELLEKISKETKAGEPYYIEEPNDLPLVHFKIMRKLKYEGISVYEIIEEGKYPIEVAPDKKEVVLYIKKEPRPALKDMFITDSKGNRYKLSEIAEIPLQVYQIVKIPVGISGLEPGKWEIEIGLKYGLKKVILGLLSMFMVGIFISIFLLYRLYRFYHPILSGTLKIKEDKGESPKVRKLVGREMFFELSPEGISLKKKITDSSIARLYPTKDNDYRVNLEVTEKKWVIWIREGILTRKVKLIEGIKYHLKSPEHTCILSYFENNPNPYTPGKLVSEEVFAPRGEVDKIVDNFRTLEPKVFLLWGPLCSGKTSIIQEVERKLQESHHFIKIDITNVLSARVKDETFLGILLSEICRRLPVNNGRYLNEMRNMDSPSLLKERFLAEFNKFKGKRFLISIDKSPCEFQRNGNNFSIQNLEELINFFKDLNNSSLCLLISYSKIEPLISDQESWNRLKNNCELLQIGLLETDSAEKLISKIEENCLSLKIKKSVIDKIKDLSGKHPYFIQLLCCALIDYYNKRKVKLSARNVERCAENVFERSDLNLTFWSFWQKLTNFERVFLCAVVELRKENSPVNEPQVINLLKEKRVEESKIDQISQHFNSIWKALSQHLIFHKKGEGIFCIPLWERWIRENISFDIVSGEFQGDE